MGNARKRASPAMANHVNQDLDNLMLRSIVRAHTERDRYRKGVSRLESVVQSLL